MGLSIAQMALLGGADDAGSTMMEENVVSAHLERTKCKPVKSNCKMQ